MSHTWQTLSGGEVVVDGAVPTLTPQEAATFDKNVWRWSDEALEVGRRHGVPAHWILGMVWRESGGIPTAKSPDGGLGLMQLTSSAAKAGYPDAQLLNDPRLNLELGARYIKRITRPGDQLPEVASKFNAGQQASGEPHPSNQSPWGLRETPGHITAVVRAANYAAPRLGQAANQEGRPAPLSEGAVLAASLTVLRWLT